MLVFSIVFVRFFSLCLPDQEQSEVCKTLPIPIRAPQITNKVYVAASLNPLCLTQDPNRHATAYTVDTKTAARERRKQEKLDAQDPNRVQGLSRVFEDRDAGKSFFAAIDDREGVLSPRPPVSC